MMEPNLPSTLLLGPAVKTSSFAGPLFVFGTPSPKIDCPQLIDRDYVARCVPHRADKRTCDGIERIDCPAVGVVRNQQSIAQGPKPLGAAANPHGWISGAPFASVFRKTPLSL